jgi:hypothetical protein
MAVVITTEPGNPNRIKVALAAGDTSSWIPCGGGDAVITATPGSGGTMLAQATWSPWDECVAGTARPFDWDAGTVSAKNQQLLIKATAVRFTATTQAGVGEVAR